MPYIIALNWLDCVHVRRVFAVKWLQPRPTTPHVFPKHLNHVAQQTKIELRQIRERVRAVLLHTFKITHNVLFFTCNATIPHRLNAMGGLVMWLVFLSICATNMYYNMQTNQAEVQYVGRIRGLWQLFYELSVAQILLGYETKTIATLSRCWHNCFHGEHNDRQKLQCYGEHGGA